MSGVVWMDKTHLAEMIVAFALEGDEKLLQWLGYITGRKLDVMESEHGKPVSWVIDSPGGMRVGISRSDPIAVAVQIGFALADMWWPFVLGDLMDLVKREWRRKRRCAKSAGKQAPE